MLRIFVLFAGEREIGLADSGHAARDPHARSASRGATGVRGNRFSHQLCLF